MRARVIIIADAFADDMPRVIEIAEQILIQTLIPEPAVECLTEGILRRLAGRDVMPLKASVLRPAEDGAAGQLGAVV